MSLAVQNLSVYLGEKRIIKDVNLEVKSGKLLVLMGPNGSGKTTLAQTLMGNPSYKIQNPKSKIQINKKDITFLSSDERAKEGLFLAFQNPVAVAGVSVANLLKIAYQVLKNQNSSAPVESTHNPALSVWEFNEILLQKAKKLSIPQEFLGRSLNDEFSSGEKKKLEMLQAAILEPKFAIFDEIDTGLDVDALKTVAHGIDELKKRRVGILLITHYQRILRLVKPDFVSILMDGRIVATGGYKLAQEIEKKGYSRWMSR